MKQILIKVFYLYLIGFLSSAVIFTICLFRGKRLTFKSFAEVLTLSLLSWVWWYAAAEMLTKKQDEQTK